MHVTRYMTADAEFKLSDEKRLRRKAARLIAAARRYAKNARGRLKSARDSILAAQEDLARSRNAVQAAWLLRDLRRRLGRKR